MFRWKEFCIKKKQSDLEMSEEFYYMLISKSNVLVTGLKHNLCLKAAKCESITPRTFLSTVQITLLKEVFQHCCSHPNKK